MTPKKPSLAERTRVVHALRRKARDEAGLASGHPLLRDIDRLEKSWDARALKRIQKGLANYLARREGAVRVGDRVPPPGTFLGELALGHAHALAGPGARVNLAASRLALGSIILGLIGTGKSHLVSILLRTLIATEPLARVLLLDPNRTYEACCHDSTLWLNVPWESVRINPLRAPKGYSYAKWIPQVFDYLARGELLHARYFLVTRALELFTAWMVPDIDDGHAPVPSLFDLARDLRERRCKPGSKEEAYRQSALHVLHGRIETSGSVFDCNRGMEDLLTDTRVRIATDGLSPLETHRFFINALLHFSYRRRSLAGPGVCDNLLVTVIEEAASLLERRDHAPMDFYQELFLRSRVLNIGYVLITQDLQSIHPAVFGGISNSFLFGMSSAADKRLARHLLDLSVREEELLGELGQGECFVKLAGHPTWPYPFIMKVNPHV